MSYRFKRRESVGRGVRRIAAEELDAGLRQLGHDELSLRPEEAVHDCRRRVKKVRGLLRMVRPTLKGRAYATTNRLARDAGRELSAVRDRSAAHDTLVALSRLCGAETEERFAPLVHAAVARREATFAGLGVDDIGVAAARQALLEARAGVDGWRFTEKGWAALAPGLAATYAAARTAGAIAAGDPTEEHMHEWRKRVKDVWYHTRLLTPMAPEVLRDEARVLRRLSETLGDAHDLVVLAAWLRAADPGPADRRDQAIALADAVRTDLERRAVGAGRVVFAEPPGRHVRRRARYWSLWHEHGDAGPLARLRDLT